MEKTTLNKNEKKNIRTMYFRKKKIFLEIFLPKFRLYLNCTSRLKNYSPTVIEKGIIVVHILELKDIRNYASFFFLSF